MRLLRGRVSLLAALYFSHLVLCEVVYFDLVLTWEDREVAGVIRKVIHSNYQFPGPTLRLKQGDEVEVLVTNLMPFSTTVHFHGIIQMGTPWSDGTPGLSQAPIEPGEQFLYRWMAVDYGSYAYHAHSRAQLMDGLYGAIYIEPAKLIERPFELITHNAGRLAAMLSAEANTEPIILSDWRSLTSDEILQAQLESGCENLCSHAILLNGKGSAWCLSQERLNALTKPAQKTLLGNNTLTDIGCFPPLDSFFGTYPRNPSVLPYGFNEGCTPGYGSAEVVEVNPRSQYISRDLISMVSSATLAFSIDEHPMYVYAIDGRYIEPVLVEAIELPAGSRYSVLVELKQNSSNGEYTIRAANTGLNQIINGTAVMSYRANRANRSGQRPSLPYITEFGSPTSAKTTFLDEASVIPFPIALPSSTVSQTIILNVGHYHASYRWQLGNSSFPLNYEEVQPALFNTSAIPFPYVASTLNDTWVDIIFNLTSGGQPPHPMHKHSNKFFVIGQGNTPFIYSSVAEAVEVIPQNFNFEHPQIRDTFSTPIAAGPLGTWLAVRYFVENPGPFLVHCHLQMHQAGGMALALMDGIDAWPVVPEEYHWAAYYGGEYDKGHHGHAE
ncbi:multicopper oxidase-domain-containing protein [Aspergillus karnatakaensis]|uniref:multicopper oxidase-domain-containing protein n=1 Tax=Aspergillus karnatakaensis TaxID=1810916 RepID=UPI003CCD7ED7